MDATRPFHLRLRNRLFGSLADPRLFQIAALGVLLASGAWFRDFSLRPAQIVLTFGAGLIAQRFAFRFNPDKPRSYRSAIITSLSLTLLLRADNLIGHPIAAAAAIGSKSLFRINGKHVFNPATFGLIFALIALPGTWVSPGQWGADLALAGWLVALGTIVTSRARRADISWTFLGFYLGAIASRMIWLGQRWAVWTHQLGSGALLLFAFFMISDPMTTPNHRYGRIVHAALVALIAYEWQFGWYRTNGLIWALFIAAVAVPVWDAIWPAKKFEWPAQGGSHELVEPAVPDLHAPARDPFGRQAA